MTDCCKFCDGWPDEGYCKAQGQCGCHTPENPAQEKHIGEANEMVGANHFNEANRMVDTEEKCQGECHPKWALVTDDGCICPCHETKKPPTEEAAPCHSPGDTDTISEEWAGSLDETIRDNLIWYKENGSDHGDLVIAEEAIKTRIRNLPTSQREIDIEANVEFIAVHRDDWIAEGAKGVLNQKTNMLIKILFAITIILVAFDIISHWGQPQLW